MRKHVAIFFYLKSLTTMKPNPHPHGIGGVDLDGGQVVLFDESLSNEERVNTLISSAAVPFAFPFEEIDGMALVDGSLFTTISIGDPISRCREEVEKDEDIIVDVIMCYSDVKTIK